MKKIMVLAALVLVMMVSIKTGMAATYTVGAPGGSWDQSTDLTTWASSQTFSVGDTLIFQYTLNHDVTEVSKADFDSCSSSNPLQPPHTGGATTIALTSAGNRYFICGTGGHCLGGMKVEIDILAAASAPPPPTTPVIPPPPPPAATPRVPSPPPTPSAVSSPPPAATPKVPSPPPTPSAVSSPPPVKSMAPSPPPTPPPKLSPSSPPTKAAGQPKLPPAPAPPPSLSVLPPASAPPPGVSVLKPSPPPSSAVKFSSMGALVTACSGFILILFFNL
ncbi:hypothetical protein ACP275_13G023100 [Erythranthe tilingii]